MHPPYLVLTWGEEGGGGEPSAEFAAILESGGWRRALGAPRLAVWDRPERPLPVAQHQSAGMVILGRCFERNAIGDRLSRPWTAEAAARWLCAHGWGSYVALLRSRDGSWRALRDPSGAVEAYTWRSGGLGVLASGLVNLPARLLPPQLGIDWAAIADFLVRPESILARTALDGVHVVCPGRLQAIGSGASSATAVWGPADHLPTASDDRQDGVVRLPATLAETVARLVEPYDRLMVEVSGGFDSSLVAAALGQVGAAPKVVSALHYVGDRHESDERIWAAQACAPGHLPLDCVPRTLAAFDPEAEFAELSRDARPIYAALDGVRDRDTAARLQASGAQALLTGKGGDAIFFSMPSARVVADLWRDRGWRALRHPLNPGVARWLRLSVWSLWREAFGAGTRRAELSVAPFAGPNLAPAAGVAHPWLDGLDAAPRGKRVQVEALVAIQAAIGLSRRGGVADIVQPLLAQPMVELCLSIPTWRLVGEGRDRGLARAVFAPWLPAAVAARRSKSRLTSIYARRLAGGLPAMRDHLLGGVLVDAGLLDARAVDAALQEDALMAAGEGLALFPVAAVESWVRYWQTRIPDATHAPRRPAA